MKRKILSIVLIVLVLIGVADICMAKTYIDPSDIKPNSISTKNDYESEINSMESVATMVTVVGIIGTIVGIVIYLIPTVVACKRRHPHKVGIILIDIFLGWTLLGWVGSLVWACILPNDNDRRYGNKYEDLETLQKLKEKGAITEAEFELEKNKLFR